MPALDDATLQPAVEALAARDSDLAGIVARHGSPPLWSREPGFETLVQIILEQQVSLGSAVAAVERLRSALVIDAFTPLTPHAVLGLGEEAMRAAGITRQKAGYLVGLASDLTSGRLDLGSVAAASDEDAGTVLMTVAGIGRWKAMARVSFSRMAFRFRRSTLQRPGPSLA